MAKTVFITWSGNETKPIAEILNSILNTRFKTKNIHFFYSAQEIRNGKIWINSIMEKLNDCCFGIVCLSSLNANSPWLNFETGGIIKGVWDKKKIFIFNTEKINPRNIASPLNMFQINNKGIKEKLEELYQNINGLLDESDKFTEKAIVELSKEDAALYIEQSSKILNEETDLFISFPIRGISNLKEESPIINKVVKRLEEHGTKVYCSAVIGQKENINSIAVARINLIKKCKAYVIIHPEITASFTLIECGIALALDKPTLIIGKNTNENFPTVLIDMVTVGTKLGSKNHSICSYTNENDLFDSIKSFITDYL